MGWGSEATSGLVEAGREVRRTQALQLNWEAEQQHGSLQLMHSSAGWEQDPEMALPRQQQEILRLLG